MSLISCSLHNYIYSYLKVTLAANGLANRPELFYNLITFGNIFRRKHRYAADEKIKNL